MYVSGYSKDFIHKAVNIITSDTVTRNETRKYISKNLDTRYEKFERADALKEIRHRSQEYSKRYGKGVSYVKDRENGFLYYQTDDTEYYEGISVPGSP